MSKSPSLRRIQADVRELSLDPSDRYHAAPLEEDMFEWHFTIRGSDTTDFEGGIYHGRILLPPEYPFKPPNIVFLTPSGRFETGTKICLSFSAFHPELWQPAWGIRLILEALISFLPTPADGGIGALDWTKAERNRLAKESVKYCCRQCGPAISLIPKIKGSKNQKSLIFEEEIAKLHMHQIANEVNNPKNPKNLTAAKLKSEKKDGTTPEESMDQSPDTQAEPKGSEQPDPEEESAETKARSEELPTISLENPASVQLVPSQVEESAPWFSDPVVHGGIVIFATIVFLLYRKVESLILELKELEI